MTNLFKGVTSAASTAESTTKPAAAVTSTSAPPSQLATPSPLPTGIRQSVNRKLFTQPGGRLAYRPSAPLSHPAILTG